MSNYYNPNNCPIVQPTCNQCPPIELGRVRGWFAMTQAFYETNPDFTQLLTFENAVCNQVLWLFPKTQGFATQNPKIVDAFGSRPQRVSSYEYDLKLVFSGIQNIEFWNSIQVVDDIVVGYWSQTKLYIASANAMIVPTSEVPADITMEVNTEVEVKFIQNQLIVPITLPAGLADICIDC